ncbi:MAG: hypothetical protein OMM_14924 [Candidatus Magnetoglobus multicellularis str. Araruama]|uniref:Uncharacterized protein n=1 Tax=Candidatus Magnetoglobus multicellularis str. Araruama TaxID=890399 RepID=A0A1V1NR16_9BACT|nr:MAG: hypothetical protein OMM_14924 [Candidatus Magnetoglobus multicellularis str. Araruama]
MPASIEFDDKKFNAHLFFSEKAEVDQKHHFLATLLEFEEKVIGQEFKTLKEYLDYKKIIFQKNSELILSGIKQHLK